MANTQNLKKLHQLIMLTQDSLTKDEFIQYFKFVIDHAKKLELDLEERIDTKTDSAKEALEALIEEYRDTLLKIEEENSASLLNLKKRAMDKVSDFLVKSKLNEELGSLLHDVHNQMELVEARLGLVDDKIEELNSHEFPSADHLVEAAVQRATEGALEKTTEFVVPMIPDKKEILDELELQMPELGIPIRNSLELLEGDDRLDAKAIRGLEDTIRSLRKEIQNLAVVHVGGGGGGAGSIVKSYDISGDLDGSTKTFTLPNFFRIISVHSSSFPRAFRETTDYTVDQANSQITFTSEINAATTLAAGQTVTILYSE